MTEEEAQQALDQQTPVMARWGGDGWIGPHVVTLRSRAAPGWWLVGRNQWVTAADLRPATPHELLTAEEGTG